MLVSPCGHAMALSALRSERHEVPGGWRSTAAPRGRGVFLLHCLRHRNTLNAAKSRTLIVSTPVALKLSRAKVESRWGRRHSVMHAVVLVRGRDPVGSAVIPLVPRRPHNVEFS